LDKPHTKKISKEQACVLGHVVTPGGLSYEVTLGPKSHFGNTQHFTSLQTNRGNLRQSDQILWQSK